VFILTLTYLEDLAEIDALLPAHREYLEHHYREGRFLLSGRQEPRTGGFILASGDDPDEMREITRTDPFVTSAVARYDITRVTPTGVGALLGDGLAAAGLTDLTVIG
jgi:uncharacterized protein YciI